MIQVFNFDVQNYTYFSLEQFLKKTVIVSIAFIILYLLKYQQITVKAKNSKKIILIGIIIACSIL
ncbi:hypothetical protein FACS1894170_11800 [Planctomycetales bacterium]|nr:hypothetical protein FACS1894170_11800 [Planctomycetales bacterium]